MRSEAAANQALQEAAQKQQAGWKAPSTCKRSQKPVSWWQKMLSRAENR